MQDLHSRYPSHHKSPLKKLHNQNKPIQATPCVGKVHLVYYLCHGANLLGHPHLLQLSLPSNQPAIYLRDVKKCLSSVRGNYLFTTFAWSYRRCYKNGYVWQDVFHDEDLIFPLHAPDQYVLKGSEIQAHNCRLIRSSHTKFTPVHQQLDAENISNRFSSTVIGRARVPLRRDVATQTEEETTSDESEEEQQRSHFNHKSVLHPVANPLQPLISPSSSISSTSSSSYESPVPPKKVKTPASITDTIIIDAGKSNRSSTSNQTQKSTSILQQLASCRRPDLDVRKPTSVFRASSFNQKQSGTWMLRSHSDIQKPMSVLCTKNSDAVFHSFHSLKPERPPTPNKGTSTVSPKFSHIIYRV